MNQSLHNLDSPVMIGEVKDSDVVKEISGLAILMKTKIYLFYFINKFIYYVFFTAILLNDFNKL